MRRDLLLEEIESLIRQVRRIEQQLNPLAQQPPAVAQLRSIPGVGIRTAEAVAAFVDDPHRSGPAALGKVCENAVVELGNIGAPAASAIPTLVKLLEGSNGDIRTQAAISLGKMGPAAKPALEALRKAQRYAELDTQEAVDAIKAAIEAIEMPEMEKEKMI